MNANTARHGKAANAATTTHPAAGAGDACRRSSRSATGQAGDVPAADTTGKEATMQPDEQTPNTPAPFTAKRKNAARRKEKRKAREAAQRKSAYWAKQGVPREIRAWLDAIDS